MIMSQARRVKDQPGSPHKKNAGHLSHELPPYGQRMPLGFGLQPAQPAPHRTPRLTRTDT